MNTLLEKLSAIRLVPVVVINDAEKAVPLARALMDNGCGCMEITFRTPPRKPSPASPARCRTCWWGRARF